jgi:hypothetical protein
MLYTQQKVSGLDINIQSYQQYLYPKLKQLWSIKTDDEISFDSFGRAYRNLSETGYVPEVFNSSLGVNNTEYRQLIFDQVNNAAVTFFSVSDTMEFKNGSAVTKASLMFLLNLGKVSSVAWRPDEDVKNAVLNLMQAGKYGFELSGCEVGYKNVFREYDGLQNKDQVIFNDRHPLYCFRVNMNLVYNVND